MEDIIKPPEIKQKEELVDVILDIDLTTDNDELETIRFESVPERKRTNTIIPIETSDCISFSWIFSCFF
jgi:hypothetical protein